MPADTTRRYHPVQAHSAGTKDKEKDAAASGGRIRSRIWEIDFLRGLSIILMVFYHAGYDLNEFCGIKTLAGVGIDVSGPGLSGAQLFFAGLFILLSGISSTLSRSNVRRALRLLAIALVVTAVTYVFDASQPIHFGILHCLGTSILIYGLTMEKSGPRACAAAAAAVLGLSAALSFFSGRVQVDFDWLLPFGIHSNAYASVDYFPLLPWFSVFMAGTVLGKSAYGPKASLLPGPLPETFINIAGRHSLLIYIIHQPVILAVLYVSGLMG